MHVVVRVLPRSPLPPYSPFKHHYPRHPLTITALSGSSIVKTKINEKCAMSLDLPPLVRSGVFFLLLYIFQSG